MCVCDHRNESRHLVSRASVREVAKEAVKASREVEERRRREEGRLG